MNAHSRRMVSPEPSECFLCRRVHSDNDIQMEQRPCHPLLNFIILSVLFSVNHGVIVSCLAFATLQFGATAAWQLVFFHLVYAASALLGATYLVKQLGPRNSMILGMGLNSTYVGCFWMAMEWHAFMDFFAVVGAVLGGVGGGLVWTAQGAYFGRASQDYAVVANVKSDTATSFLASMFAFIYLSGEVICKLLSWAILQSQYSKWTTVFGVYTVVAVSSTSLLTSVHNYSCSQDDDNHSIGYKMTVAWQLLRHNQKIPYMIGLNAVFGFAYPFVNSYVNGEVVHRVLVHDTNLRYVGIFSALSSAVAAICSVVFCRGGKAPVLMGGAVSFAAVALLFLIRPNLNDWGWEMLSAVYILQGMGRATFEGALRATYADFFPEEIEGAFANIILQNGIFTALGFGLSFSVTCSHEGPYCVQYKEGGLHNVLVLELAVVLSAVIAILGYWKAASLNYQSEEMGSVFENEEESQFIIFDLERVIDTAPREHPGDQHDAASLNQR